MSSDDQKLVIIQQSRSKLMEEIDELKKQLQNINEEMKLNGFISNGKITDPKTQFIEVGKLTFNKDPKEGLKFLFDKNVLNKDSDEVARFLFEQILDKKAIGDYLGEVTREFNQNVLKSYIQLFNFTNISFVESLRIFLKCFTLPGESQKIENIMHHWSQYFHQSNPGVFNNGDEAFILAYATMMLNTTLHNSTAVRQQIDFGREDVFVKEMLEYENVKFKEDLIGNVYQTIRDHPLENLMPNDLEYWKEAVLKGKLYYQSANVKTWQMRLFVLLPEYLLILNDCEKLIRYKISLDHTKIDRAFNLNKEHALLLLPDNQEFIVATKVLRNSEEQKNMKMFRFACNSPEEQKEWKNAIQNCINKINEGADQYIM